MPAYKSTRFSYVTRGESFSFGGNAFVKTAPRKATRQSDKGPVEESFRPSDQVEVIDRAETARLEAEAAKPVFDGTENSCKTRQDYYVLDGAMRDVTRATEELDEMADYVTRKMAEIKQRLRSHGVTDLARVNRWDPKLGVTPASVTEFIGLNSCGELQGNGNVDMAVAKLIAKREAFLSIVSALGYRVK